METFYYFPIILKGIQKWSILLSTNQLFFFRKLYSVYLLKKLLDWMESEPLLGHEQIGFRWGSLEYSHCLVLYLLAEKYSSFKNIYIDNFYWPQEGLQFYHLPQTVEQILITMDKRLLGLIQQLYSSSTVRIQCGYYGSLINAFNLEKGV